MERSRGALFRRWTVAFTLGELIGFGLIPAAGGLAAYALTDGMAAAPRALLLYAVAIVGGFGEGAVLARFQLGPLREVFVRLDGRRWVLHTGVAASVAWAAGMLTPTLDDVLGLGVGAQIALWMACAVVILLSIGMAQARLLARHVERPRRWLWANVVGWIAGLPWTFVLPALVPDDAPVWAFGIAMLLGGVLMGATTGAVTGLWLVRMAGERTA
jgi:hypothetical protein